ncbi:MAG: DUF4114 domain-containing protein [Myxococcales bacterium]|nr:DUF4114 domain-containing protein [Myxococcales bacterium]
MRKRLGVGSVLAVVLGGLAALGLVQPDNTTIPVGPSLQDLFNARGESIDALADASVTPETFTPGCALTFEVLQRNAGYMNSFGWYNVTGQKPADAELHEFLACTDGVGTVKVLDIKNDPAYAGGDIGFYQATGPCGTTTNYLNIFYSEKGYNPDGNQLNPFIHLLIYNSTATPKAFYFGWEDLLAGGDNDFDDLTTFVTGITCSGGGGQCATGQLGVCAVGTLQCQSGLLECLALNQPTAEVCDALDNDCNGAPDDGAGLCPVGEVCDRGSCVPMCDNELHQCPPSLVCGPAGVCIDAACVGVPCPADQKCVAGQCVGACDGVVCPYDELCLAGTCIDPCSVITCDSPQVCQHGACKDPCQCSGCAADETCQNDGRCIYTACVGQSCGPGEHCAPDGTCVDDCAGVVCPGGDVCQEGACVPAGAGGGGGGGSGQGGGFHFGGNGQGAAGAAVPAGGASARADASESSGGCGCRTAARPTPGLSALALLALGAALGVRRRRAS